MRELIQLSVAVVILFIVATFHYHYRKLCFRRQPFTTGGRTHRDPKIVTIFEHLSVGLVLIPAVEIAYSFVELVFDDGRAALAKMVVMAVLGLVGLLAYPATLQAELFIDAIEFQSQGKKLVPVRSLQRRFTYLGLALMHVALCSTLLYSYTPSARATILKALDELRVASGSTDQEGAARPIGIAPPESMRRGESV